MSTIPDRPIVRLLLCAALGIVACSTAPAPPATEPAPPEATVTRGTINGPVSDQPSPTPQPAETAGGDGERTDAPSRSGILYSDPDSPLGIPRTQLEDRGLEYRDPIASRLPIGPFEPPETGGVPEYGITSALVNGWEADASDGLGAVVDVRYVAGSEQEAERFLAETRSRNAARVGRDLEDVSERVELGDGDAVYDAGTEEERSWLVAFRSGRVIAVLSVGGGPSLTEEEAFEIMRAASDQLRTVPEDALPTPAPTPEGGETGTGGSTGGRIPFPTEGPTATATPVPPDPTVTGLEVVGEGAGRGEGGVSTFPLQTRRLTIRGSITDAPEGSSLRAKVELVRVPKGYEITQPIVNQQTLPVSGTQPFAFDLEFAEPPSEGSYEVTISLTTPRTLVTGRGSGVEERVEFALTAPPPRLIAEPGRAVGGGGTGSVVVRFPEGAEPYQYILENEEGQEVVEQLGVTLRFQERPGEHQVPPGEYTLSVFPSQGVDDPGVYRVVVAAGRETLVNLGALRLNARQAPGEILLVDEETGRPAGSELVNTVAEDSLLERPQGIPAGRYGVYFKSGQGDFVRVGEATVRPGRVTELEI